MISSETRSKLVAFTLAIALPLVIDSLLNMFDRTDYDILEAFEED